MSPCAVLLVAACLSGDVPRVVDSGGFGFSSTSSSVWSDASLFGGSSVRLSTSMDRGVFRFSGLPAGTYNVALTWASVGAPASLQSDVGVVAYDGEEEAGSTELVAVLSQVVGPRSDFAAVDSFGRLRPFQGVGSVTVDSGVCTVSVLCGSSSGEALADAVVLVPAVLGVGDGPLLGELVEQGGVLTFLLTCVAVCLALMWGAYTWELIVLAKNQDGLW